MNYENLEFVSVVLPCLQNTMFITTHEVFK